MADDDDNYEVETGDAGASHTYPMEAGSCRKGCHLMIKGFPCKVIEVTTSKTGKHGHAKCHFVATDIFTGKKMEELVSSSHNVAVPFVVRQEYTIMDIADDGTLSLLTEGGEPKDDLNLPDETDDDKKNVEGMKKEFDAGKNVIVIVQAACGKEKVVSYRSTE
jgi:translation initiation factor 5A